MVRAPISTASAINGRIIVRLGNTVYGSSCGGGSEKISNPKSRLLAGDALPARFCDIKHLLYMSVPAPKGEGDHIPAKPYVREPLHLQSKQYPAPVVQWMSNPCPRTDVPGYSRASAPERPPVTVSGSAQQ